MTLEDKINQIYKQYNIEYTPFDIRRAFFPKRSKRPFSLVANHNTQTGADRWKEIDNAIKESSLAECLTSPSEYIRESKKYFESVQPEKQRST